jgi:outer membrane protein
MDAILGIVCQRTVRNAENQVEATQTQLQLAEERLTLRSIALSDYLQVKSQLASEKQNLASALTQLTLSRVNLMQLMEIPVNDSFNILYPEVDSLINAANYPDADSVFRLALSIKPQIQAQNCVKNLQHGSIYCQRKPVPFAFIECRRRYGYSSALTGLNYQNN